MCPRPVLERSYMRVLSLDDLCRCERWTFSDHRQLLQLCSQMNRSARAPAPSNENNWRRDDCLVQHCTRNYLSIRFLTSAPSLGVYTRRYAKSWAHVHVGDLHMMMVLEQADSGCRCHHRLRQSLHVPRLAPAVQSHSDRECIPRRYTEAQFVWECQSRAKEQLNTKKRPFFLHKGR